MHESARATARNLLGGDRIGTWTVIDARHSSGLRVTLASDGGGRELSFVFRPPGGPAFLTTKRMSVLLEGTTQDEGERALVREIARRAGAHEHEFPPGALEEALEQAMRVRAPVPGEPIEGHSLRPTESEIPHEEVPPAARAASTCDAGDVVLANPPPYLEQPWMGAGIPLISAVLAEAGFACRIVRLLEDDIPTPEPIMMACERTRWTSRTLHERLTEIRALATQFDDFFEGMLANLLEGPETIFGFTTWRHNSDVVLELARRLRDRRPGCLILLGGPEAAEAPFNLYDEHVDVIVGGRAEALAPMAVRALQNGHPEELAALEDVWVNPRFQPRVYLAKKSVQLPPIPRIDYSRLVPLLLHPRHTIIPVVLNVGCPFNCGFCANKSVYPEMEWSTPKRLFEEIDQIVSCWEEVACDTPGGSLELFLCDATVNAQPAQFDELCRMIIAAPWRTRPRLSGAFIVDGRITPERVRLFTDAGCSSFFFGLESASARVRREMKKPGTLAAVAEGLLNIRDHGQGRFRVNVGVLVGWPSETEEDFHATVAFVEWMASLGIVGEVTISPLYRAVGPMNPGIFEGAEGMGYTWRMNGPGGSPAVRFRRFIGFYEHFAMLKSSLSVLTCVVPRLLVELMLPDAPVSLYDAWATGSTPANQPQ